MFSGRFGGVWGEPLRLGRVARQRGVARLCLACCAVGKVGTVGKVGNLGNLGRLGRLRKLRSSENYPSSPAIPILPIITHLPQKIQKKIPPPKKKRRSPEDIPKQPSPPKNLYSRNYFLLQVPLPLSQAPSATV